MSAALKHVVIISDLHMSAGCDPVTNKLSRKEDFFHDAALANFLQYWHDRVARDHHSYRLLILGDLLDFLRTDLDASTAITFRPDTSTPTTLAKLERMARGHPRAFEALGRFAAAGLPIDIVPGNHDLELIRPATQACFREWLVHYSGQAAAATNINFYPWIYYVPGVFYAEHGQQYHDINSLATLLRPYVAQDPEVLKMPLGSLFELYLCALVDAIDPAADPIKPLLRYFRRAFRAHPLKLLTTWRYHMCFLRLLSAHLEQPPGQRTTDRDAAYQEVLINYSHEIDLDHETVAGLDRLALTIRANLLRRLLGKIVHGAGPSDYLRQAATAIDQLLCSQNKSVPYYIFGHTHVASQLPLTSGRVARYLNSGTWTSLTPLRHSNRLTFIQITYGSETPAPIAQLLRWNDTLGVPEPFSNYQHPTLMP